VLADGASGVLPSQHLAAAVEQGWIGNVVDSAIQPASIDLHLGAKAYRIRCSFLPGDDTVERRVKGYIVDELDLTGEGAVLETQRPYLIPLQETLDLPPHLRARTNPKSSTGRLDVFTRVITDHGQAFDDIPSGYRGSLWLEVVPLSFTVRVREGLALNQIRLLAGERVALSDEEIRQRHATEGLLFREDVPVPDHEYVASSGLFLGLDLEGLADGRVGFRARPHTTLVDMSQEATHQVKDYWDPVYREEGNRVVLAPGAFYLLLSDEAVVIPPDLAAEMAAYDPTAGELRTHYAGFFDPGFGYDPSGMLRGSRAALEVRAHDVPFMVEHRQPVAKLTFERMIEPPERLYGAGIGSNYQGQVETLGKHFIKPTPQPRLR
jgi:dCTP deaminase